VTISADNPVVALCAAGMAREGEQPAEALALFEQAWSIRKDDVDAAVAAHYVARHQPNAEATLHWNQVALEHAQRVEGHGATHLMASLYLNFGDSLAGVGRHAKARDAVERAATSLAVLPAGGYRDLLAGGIRRLQERLAPGPR
jgi:hypothetical protein